MAHEQSAAALAEIRLLKRERLPDSQPRAPQHDDQPTHAITVDAITGLTHDRDDLLDPGRIGG